MPTSDTALLESSLNEFEKTQQDLTTKFNSALTKLDVNFKALDDCVVAHKSQLQEYTRLVSMLKQVESESATSDPTRNEWIATVKARLAKTKSFLDRLNDTKPRTGSLFLRLMMGQVNVKVWKKGEQLNFKDEYNKFKARTTWIFIGFPMIQLLFYRAEWLWKLHQCWLVYYYISLALRENILQVNGSSIQAWWIFHHYLAGCISMMSLLWPQDYQLWSQAILWFGFLQGCVMWLQNRYQKHRLYVRKTLGKAKDVDVDTSETIEEKPTDLKMLVPMLYGLYAFEFIFGLHLVYSLRTPETVVMGILFAVLGLGNAFTTTRVLMRQSSQRRINRDLKKLPPLNIQRSVSDVSTASTSGLGPSKAIACGLVTTPGPVGAVQHDLSPAITNANINNPASATATETGVRTRTKSVSQESKSD